MFLLMWIICACLVIQSGANPKREIKNDDQHINPLPQVDALGPITQLIDKVLSQLTRNMSTPMDYECSTRSLFFGGFEFKIIHQPFGFCSYCCPLKGLTDHIHLYFTNKAMFGNFFELKLAKKPGAFRSAGVSSNVPTVVYIHGFTEHGRGASAQIIRDAYLTRSEVYNIILVDWSDLAAGPWYPQAVENVKLVGKFLGEIIKFYNGTGELPISKLHLIGFSLGGQIVGFVGKSLKDVQKIPRITALDPAFPLFPMEDVTQRLSKFDAEFVDVIHTDGGTLGYPIPLGHADFYPNGGKILQPGCEVSKLIEIENIQDLATCGHIRAYNFYAESVINPKAFPATKCGVVHKGSYKRCRFIVHGYMGFPASKKTTLGNFFLTTNDYPPFSRSAKEQQRDMQAINLLL